MPRKKQQNPQPVKCMYRQISSVLDSWVIVESCQKFSLQVLQFSSTESICAFGSVIYSVCPDSQLASGHQMFLFQPFNHTDLQMVALLNSQTFFQCFFCLVHSSNEADKELLYLIASSTGLAAFISVDLNSFFV